MWSVSVSSWPLISILFEAGLKQVCSWLAKLRLAFDMLSTCLRHAHASLRPGLQLARIMECGLYDSRLPEQLLGPKLAMVWAGGTPEKFWNPRLFLHPLIQI